jgi:hypothetical protein
MDFGMLSAAITGGLGAVIGYMIHVTQNSLPLKDMRGHVGAALDDHAEKMQKMVYTALAIESTAQERVLNASESLYMAQNALDKAQRAAFSATTACKEFLVDKVPYK